jgi:guanylate kinase
MRGGVMLYGPPASGKDTVTASLHDICPSYRLFRRLKAGPGRRAGYRLATDDQLDCLTAAGDVVWENFRYGARYVIDRTGLDRQLSQGIPVVHIGQTAAIDAVRQAIPDAYWLLVLLWCDRKEARRRMELRATGDTASRLAAWDETEAPSAYNLRIDTGNTSAQAAAVDIHNSWCQFSARIHGYEPRPMCS